MTSLTIAAIGTLLLAAYLAALSLALHRTRRASLVKRCEDLGKAHLSRSLADHRSAALLTVSLFRTAARVSFFVLVLVNLVGVGEGATLSWSGLLTAGAISIGAIWLCTTVVAVPVAIHAGPGLIVRSAWLVRTAAVIGTPLSKSLFFIDEAIRRLSGANLREENQTEEELLRSIEESQLEGGLEAQAAAMLENVVEFRDAEVSEVMTPRTDIEGIEYTDDLSRIRRFIRKAGHSRIPVYRDNLDQIEGILYVKDLVPFLGAEAIDFKLASMLRKPIVVPETKAVPELLGDFQRSEVHLAIVIDEYGGTAGLVTIEDVLEEIVGEIHDEHEPEHEEEPSLTTIDDSRAEVDGRFHIDDLNERLNLELPEDEDYDTVAGFLLARFGRVPQEGESLEANDARFTILRATETHVQRVALELLRPVTANGEKSREAATPREAARSDAVK